jgi:hypothetical protein
MKKIKFEAILTLEDYQYNENCKEEKDWFFNKILKDPNLILHSNEIGDEIGTVKITRIIK